MNRVETIGTTITRAQLVKMGTDSQIEHFMVVTFFNNGDVTTGWSTGITYSDLCFGKTILDERIRQELFGDEQI